MSYPQKLAARLQKAAADHQQKASAAAPALRDDHVRRAKAIEAMADEFKAGDFDARLMERVASLFDDQWMRDDASIAADMAIAQVGLPDIFWLVKAEDLLCEIYDQVRAAYTEKETADA